MNCELSVTVICWPAELYLWCIVSAAQALKTAQVMALKSVAAKSTDPMRTQRLNGLIKATQSELDEMTASKPAQSESPSPVSQDLPKLPDTPAAKTFAGFVSALNSGSLATMRRFHEERAGNVENAQQDFDFFNQSGGLKVHSVVQSEANEISVLVQTKKEGNWMTFTMSVDPNPPHAAMRISMQGASAPSAK